MATGDTFAGLTVGVSTASPATYDTAGFNALTFAPVTGIVSPGNFSAKYAPVDTAVLEERATVRTKGTREAVDFSMGILLNLANAGQTMLLEGADGAEVDTNHSFEFTFSNGDVYHLQALIGSFEEPGGDGNTNRLLNVDLFFDSRGVVRS